MKKRKATKPSQHPFAFILGDEIFIVEPTYGLLPCEAEALAEWLVEAAAWLRQKASK